MKTLAVATAISLCAAALSYAQSSPKSPAPSAADRALAQYFETEVEQLSSACLADVRTVEDWKNQREQRRRELAEMLGLWPMPERSPLQPVITGRIEREDFTVEKLHFQSMPGLYMTANLYLPRGGSAEKKAPAILYVCGHSDVKAPDGSSLGNKTAYQHHGIWFARHGYVCLVLDTVQLGEIRGVHHGTYNLRQWWWNARGYTPAGAEVWNGIRALDYLETRPEVDATRIGMTGRSGGGSYTWTVAALDERVKAAAPVAGITDLRNQVIDGAVEGHCDCMFFLNTYRWDFPMVAALIAPRPLLIVNTDSDTIFPLDGVQRLHAKTRRLYQLHNADARLGLVIGPGGHKDTQDLQVPVFRWFNQHLKGEDPLIATPAENGLEPASLRVFEKLPGDERTTRIQESFTLLPEAKPLAPEEALRLLQEQVFQGWKANVPPAQAKRAFRAEKQGAALEAYDVTSNAGMPLRLFVMSAAGTSRAQPASVRLEVFDAEGWSMWLARMRTAFAEELRGEGSDTPPDSTASNASAEAFAATVQQLSENGGTTLAWIAPRGIGPTAWSGDEREQTHIRRRFMLVGQTVDAMRVWDIRRALQALRHAHPAAAGHITLAARGPMAANALYASLFEQPVEKLELSALPKSHLAGPDYLNILRVLDLPQALELARGRHKVEERP
jgi:dienelactone hydrolase